MTHDLEETLVELGPEYRGVVDRLQAAYRAPVAARAVSRAPWRRAGAFGLAAAFVLVAGLAVLLVGPRQTGADAVRPANEYRLAFERGERAIAEMIRTQNADGSWKNDFLTRQNAAALRLCASAEAHVAYKKALRNLRARGVL